MIICDTNIFIEFLRKNHSICSEIYKIGYENIVVSDVVKAEMFFGARDKVDLQNITRFLDLFSDLTIQPEIAKMAVAFVKFYCLSHKLDLPDALIAATAIYHKIELFTLNTKHFKFLPNIKLYQLQ
jgi:predicted nucleic acid-binding protein